MEVERWQHIKTIVYAALPLSEPEREAYITNACRDDEKLRKEVKELLQSIAESEETAFMAQPIFNSNKFVSDISDKWEALSSREELIGEQIGPFRITQQLGTGGMGSVFKAGRTDGQFHQQVAIKLIRKGIATEENIQRFRMEQEILATLHHPNIAQMYDGGLTGDGIPYLVMEFVDGIPVDEYCDKHQLTVDERLELFKDVCSAVQYAHSNLVIHRDLKTKNIYVTSEGAIKVLDFGVAKLLNPELTEITLLNTRPGQKLWTPQYAAPEQIKGEAITTETDVYALGVLLHKLLTGTYPLNLSGKGLSEIEQIILKTSPVAPSSTLKVDTTNRTTNNRSTSLSELKKSLSGDLDALVLKAIRKEPEYRYRSVGQLMDDIERYLNGLPLIARKDTVRYRIGKFVRRHKTAIATFFFFLILAISSATFYTWRITQERNRAEQVTQFLTNLFNQSDPMQAGGDSVTVRQVLDVGAERIEVELSDQPDLQAKMQSVIGQVYYRLAVYDKAEELLESARQKQEQFTGSQADADLAQTLLLLANINHKLSRFDKAEELGKKSLSLFEKSKGSTAPETQDCLNQLSSMLHAQGKFEEALPLTKRWVKISNSYAPQKVEEYADQLLDKGHYASTNENNKEAERLFRELLRIRTALHGEYHPQVAVALNRLSQVLFDQAKYREAELFRRKAININREAYPENHPELSWSLRSLAELLTFRGNYEEAGPLYRESIKRYMQLGDSNSINVRTSQIVYAKFLIETSQFPEAEKLLNELYQSYSNQYGDEYLFSLIIRELIAKVFINTNHTDKAQKIYLEVLKQYKIKYGERHVRSANARFGLGHALLLNGRAREAERWIRQGLDLYNQIKDSPFKKPALAKAHGLLGACLSKQGRFEEAEALLKESYQILDKHRGPKSNITQSALEYLILLYEDWGKPEKAVPYKNELVLAAKNEY